VSDVLERAIVVEVKRVTWLMQGSVNRKGFVSVNFL
jgi:hypothetical protein